MTTAVTINPFLIHQILGIQVPFLYVITSWRTHTHTHTHTRVTQ